MEKWSTADASLRVRMDAPADGARNMAIDEALFRAVESGEARTAVLRFYGWTPATISLGHHQDAGEIELERARDDGYGVVGRPTGGGAVLHANEITYAFVARWPRFGGRRPVRETYSVLADAFVSALRARGIAAERGGPGAMHAALCFSQSQAHEIHVGGRKLVGSAMRAGRRGFLLHGSILAGPEHRALADYAAPGGLPLDATTSLDELGVERSNHAALRCGIAAEIRSAWFSERRESSEAQA